MTTYEYDAEALLRKANHKKHSLLHRGPGKYEDAAELFGRAAKMLRDAGRSTDAADAYVREARCQEKAKHRYEAGNSLVKAAACAKTDDALRAARCLRASAEHFEAAGKFTAAGKHLEEAGEILDSAGDCEAALQCFERAGQHYTTENSPGHTTQCLARCGSIQAKRGRYDEAADLLEQAARESLKTELLRYSARDYLFRAGLAIIVKGDTVGAERAVEKYAMMDASFGTSKECTFLRSMVRACVAADAGLVSDAIGEFERFNKLQPWHSAMVEKIRATVAAEQNARPSSAAPSVSPATDAGVTPSLI